KQCLDELYNSVVQSLAHVLPQTQGSSLDSNSTPPDSSSSSFGTVNTASSSGDLHADSRSDQGVSGNGSGLRDCDVSHSGGTTSGSTTTDGSNGDRQHLQPIRRIVIVSRPVARGADADSSDSLSEDKRAIRIALSKVTDIEKV